MIKKIQTRHVLVVTMGVLLLVLAATVFTNYRAVPTEEDGAPAVAGANLALQKFEYTETREGRPQWSIVADSAGYRQAAGETLIENLEVIFFGEPGQAGEVVLTARHGKVDVNTRNVEIWDDVVVIAGSDYRLLTERLYYDGEQRVVSSSEPVHIVSRGFDIRGRGMRLNVATRKLEVLAEVKASIAKTSLGIPKS